MTARLPSRAKVLATSDKMADIDTTYAGIRESQSASGAQGEESVGSPSRTDLFEYIMDLMLELEQLAKRSGDQDLAAVLSRAIFEAELRRPL